MPPRYIAGRNYEIQLRNFFPSMIKAIDGLSISKTATLATTDIPDVKELEFTTFNSHDKSVKIDYQNTYRLNGRYALTVSGEYSIDCFTVLLMITDRQTKAHFGVRIKTTPSCKKIVANIPIFGIHCVINYNSDTKYYVFSIRPPLTKSELVDEKVVSASGDVDDLAWVCLHADFVRKKISFYKKHKNGKYYEYQNIDDDTPFTSFSYEDIKNFGKYNNFSSNQNSFINVDEDSNIWEDAKKYFQKGIEFLKNNIEIDQKYNIEFNPTIIEDFMGAFAFTQGSGSHSANMTYKNVGNIKGLDLYCKYGYGISGEGCSSFGANFCHRLGQYFDLTVSGEYSNGSVTAAVMVTHKYTGINFGLEMNLTGNFAKLRKPGFYIVVNVPISNTQFVFKYDITNVIIACIRPKPDNGSSNPNDDNNSKLDDDNDPDKSGAAEMGCDLICIEADFVYVKTTEEVYEYETIKGFAKTKDKALSIIQRDRQQKSNQQTSQDRYREHRHFYTTNIDELCNRPLWKRLLKIFFSKLWQTPKLGFQKRTYRSFKEKLSYGKFAEETIPKTSFGDICKRHLTAENIDNVVIGVTTVLFLAATVTVAYNIFSLIRSMRPLKLMRACMRIL